jgi:hypothetical protein
MLASRRAVDHALAPKVLLTKRTGRGHDKYKAPETWKPVLGHKVYTTVQHHALYRIPRYHHSYAFDI